MNKLCDVVITGIGAVSPFGAGVDVLWDSLLKNRNGIQKLDETRYSGDIIKIAALLPVMDIDAYRKRSPWLFNSIPENEDVLSFFIAVVEAMEQAGLNPLQMTDTGRIGVFIADRTLSPIHYIDQYTPFLSASLNSAGKVDTAKFFLSVENAGIIPYERFDEPISINHYVSRRYGITGPQLSIATACASGNTAIGEAFHSIRNGELDAVIAGGAYNFDLSGMIGFSRIEALTKNPDPESACRPFDAKRSGFVMGAGCGILILESKAHADKRKAAILARVSGYGSFSDAFRATDPDNEARSAIRSIQAALQTAEMETEAIDYINAHGTSTVLNDLSETLAIKTVFGEQAYRIPVSSTKSMIGHSIMAAAALEAIVCIKSIQNELIHPTHNWEFRDPKLDLDYVPYEPRQKKIQNAISNSFGFGGINTCVVFSAM